MIIPQMMSETAASLTNFEEEGVLSKDTRVVTGSGLGLL